MYDTCNSFANFFAMHFVLFFILFLESSRSSYNSIQGNLFAFFLDMLIISEILTIFIDDTTFRQ